MPQPTVAPTPTPQPLPPVADAPLLGPPSGSAEQARNWLNARTNSYTADEVALLVELYQQNGASVGVDWFLALAQVAHETGSLTSWWCQRPRRNPAGIGVTGAVRAGDSAHSPGASWAWDGAKWREGVSFATWTNDAVPAHIGRLLAYALTDAQANAAQRALIAKALSYRSLYDLYRGIAPTILGLNTRWAVPGTNYGEQILDLRRRMRGD